MAVQGTSTQLRYAEFRCPYLEQLHRLKTGKIVFGKIGDIHEMLGFSIGFKGWDFVFHNLTSLITHKE